MKWDVWKNQKMGYTTNLTYSRDIILRVIGSRPEFKIPVKNTRVKLKIYAGVS